MRIEPVTNIQIRTDATHSGLIRTRIWATAAWEWGNRWTRSLLLRLKPRISLATGSVLVLLTLYLPTAVDSCGHRKKGYQLLLGQRGVWWPGPCFWALNSQAPGRIFYALSLALAALTLCLVLAAVYRGEVLQKPRVFRCLFPIAGTISLLVISDFSILGLYVVPQLLLGEDSPPSHAIIAFLLLILLSFLRPEFWRMKGFLAWVFGIGAAASLLFRLESQGSLGSGTPSAYTGRALVILYLLVPLGVWYRFGLSQRKEQQIRWEKIRPRMRGLYTVATLFACLPLVFAVDGMYGLLSYFVGMHLISFGYMKLAREADPALTGVT